MNMEDVKVELTKALLHYNASLRNRDYHTGNQLNRQNMERPFESAQTRVSELVAEPEYAILVHQQPIHDRSSTTTVLLGRKYFRGKDLENYDALLRKLGEFGKVSTFMLKNERVVRHVATGLERRLQEEA